jgi:flavin reductase ActVB
VSQAAPVTPPGAIDLRPLCAAFASGVAIVTSHGRGVGPVGFTATSFASVSLSPPLVLVCLDVRAECHGVFAVADRMGISVLSAAQEDVAMRFAKRGEDKFGKTPIVLGQHVDVPLVEGALVHLECRMFSRTPAGDHTILIGEVVAGRRLAGEPLVYHDRTFLKTLR